MAHVHSIYDSDLHFIIDPITRKITSESGKVTLMQTDHNSERFTFEIPRYIEGHDMSLTDAVQIHYINLEATTPKRQNKDIYPVTDLQVSPDSEDVVIFSWLVSGNATKYAGSLNFIVRFACHNEDSEIEYQWWSDTFSLIKITSTFDNTGSMTSPDTNDILALWRQECIQAVFESDVFKELDEKGSDYVEQAKQYAEEAKAAAGLDVIEDVVSKIQTSSSVSSVPSAGWYRIAEYESTTASSANGAAANSCDILIKRGFSNTVSEYHLLRLRITYNSAEIVSLDSKSAAHLITKARHVVDTSTYKSYIDIYYDADAANGLHCTVTMGKDRLRLWKAVTPTMVDETVAGVTVTTIYDIPANASPLTNLDLDARIAPYTDEAGVELFKVGRPLMLNWDMEGVHYVPLQFSLRGSEIGGLFFFPAQAEYPACVMLYDANSEEVAQILDSNNFTEIVTPSAIGAATTADLANYLLTEGGVATEFAVGYNDFIGESGLKLVDESGEVVGYLGLTDSGFIRLTPDGEVWNIVDAENFADYITPDGIGAALASGTTTPIRQTTSILDAVTAQPDISMRVYRLDGSLYTGTDLPEPQNYYRYSTAIGFKFDNTTATVILFGWGAATTSAHRIAINQYSSGTWQGWNTNATTADLANYLPKKSPTVQASGGDYGGQMFFELSPNSGLNTGVRTENYLNTFRIMEVGGNARGAFLDLTKCANGGTSELHHDGNSSRVVLSAEASAPAEGSAADTSVYPEGTVLFTY